MRIFAVRNERADGLAVKRGRNYKDEEERSFGGYHSGGLVVLAGSLEEAQELFLEIIKPRPDDYRYKKYVKAIKAGESFPLDFEHIVEMLEEVPPSARGVVLFANGEC